MAEVKEYADRIQELKTRLGKRLFIPAHHYQRDEVVRHADYVGDSLELSRVSAETAAQYIVFCGVRFMAEIACILAGAGKKVLLPVQEAGCPLADYARRDDVELLWAGLQRLHPGQYTPVVYANTDAQVKAFAGANGGTVCTSSNAAEIFNRVLSSGKRVFFIPDRNLGMNTAVGMGLADRAVIAGTKTEEEQLRDRKIVVWDGHCSVHTVFSLRHIEQKRAERPGIRVIVHPECEPEVAAAADMAGSTAFIKKTIENALPGSFWAVGTEFNFVNRLQRENPDRSVLPLDRSVCRDMSLITEEHLFETLAGIERGDFSSRVEVDDETAADASRAIQRMFSPGEV